jgi:AAA15 family ATPase/GTPase
MILRFEVANFRSFNEPAAVLFTAGKERMHRGRVPVCGSAAGAVLPVAAIYGANAAGKTNLIEALGFLRELVVNGVGAGQGIQRQPFRLDPASASKPTVFEIDFLAENDRVFRYRLAVMDKQVDEEVLTEALPASEKTLFARRAADGSFDMSGLEKLAADEKRREFVRFTTVGTRANQPFLA